MKINVFNKVDKNKDILEIGSNYGTISVDVFAPGVNIQSTSIKNN